MTEKTVTDMHRRIPASEVREICGGVSDMSLYRWLRDPELNFPRPLYIARRRYWRAADVIAWLESRPQQLEAAG
jgi:predicted DNA-binding transcriptional regulator AlpA